MKVKLYTSYENEGRLYIAEGIKAGFPSPASDYMESFDLSQELIKHPASTFFAKVEGESMKDACILDGDLIIIDRSLEPQNGHIALCYLDGEFTLKYIRIEKNGKIWLDPANKKYKSIEIKEGNDLIIWGVVTRSIIDHLKK